MKIITYVKPEIGKPYVKEEHEVRKNYSANEEFEYWGNVCSKAMNIGRIVDYQVELAHGEVKK